jgi:CheY-like chemotaxis protein
MISLSATVLLIENDLDDAPETAEIISASGYKTTRARASNPSDVVNAIQEYAPDLIMCHTSHSNMAIEAIRQFPQTIPLILVGGPSATPMFETHPSLKIAYITAPFTEGILKAIIQLLV